ncbi:nuclear receptor binding SET domain protein-like [Chironomus tepperi]|uniref:nuclear receptor binding SET domain protein-like n=1 Tax=Chironomus tepperi TaxID=113505 RepID=UPI00391F6964
MIEDESDEQTSRVIVKFEPVDYESDPEVIVKQEEEEQPQDIEKRSTIRAVKKGKIKTEPKEIVEKATPSKKDTNNNSNVIKTKTSEKDTNNNSVVKATPSKKDTNNNNAEKVKSSKKVKNVEKAKTPSTKKRKMKKEVTEIVELKPPPSKKRKIAAEETLEELFLPDHLEEDKDCLFRCSENKIVCLKCLKGGKKDLQFCIGGCNKKFHKACLKSVEESSTSEDDPDINYLCDLCSKGVKVCAICSDDLLPEDENNFTCKQAKCSEKYHKKCLEKLSKNSKTCLKHYCHTCHLYDRSRDAKIVSCVKCPLSYHADILCIPVATQVISKTQIICPRHQQKKLKPINVNLCTFCGQNGKLILCDTCPRAFHRACMSVEVPDDNKKLFRCDECTVGILPLYNSIVWAKVGNFRWWPGFVMIPWTVPLNLLSKQKDDTEFCVRFLGTYDFCFTTYNKVFTYANADTIETLKSTTKLNIAYNKAITEARQLLEILEKNEKMELSKTSSNEFNETRRELKSSKAVYKPIQICRPVKPVKLKKISPEPCKCSPTDKSPCDRRSECINATLCIECDDSCPAGKRCQNQRVRNRDHANLRIIETKGRGFGAFCTEDIEPNTLVIEYIGEVINTDELNRRLQRKKENNEKEYYFLTIENNLCIDAEFYSNKGRFINHSCEPNCDIRKVIVDSLTRIGIFSNKFIKAGSEITFNYQMEFVKGYGIKCNCGAASCTGVIGKFFKTKKDKAG